MPRFSKQLSLIALVAMLAACADSYTPVVDMDGVNADKFQRDMAKCRSYANQVDAAGNGATDAVIGAGVGAAAGAALGALSGNAGGGALAGTAVGGLGGGGAGTAHSMARQKTIIDNCLKKRGYTILG